MHEEKLEYVSISGKDLSRIALAINDILLKEDPDHVRVACLALAITIEFPDITVPQLVTTIQGASEWISTQMAGIDEPPDKKRMN